MTDSKMFMVLIGYLFTVSFCISWLSLNMLGYSVGMVTIGEFSPINDTIPFGLNSTNPTCDLPDDIITDEGEFICTDIGFTSNTSGYNRLIWSDFKNYDSKSTVNLKTEYTVYNPDSRAIKMFSKYLISFWGLYKASEGFIIQNNCIYPYNQFQSYECIPITDAEELNAKYIIHTYHCGDNIDNYCSDLYLNGVYKSQIWIDAHIGESFFFTPLEDIAGMEMYLAGFESYGENVTLTNINRHIDSSINMSETSFLDNAIMMFGIMFEVTIWNLPSELFETSTDWMIFFFINIAFIKLPALALIYLGIALVRGD